MRTVFLTVLFLAAAAAIGLIVRENMLAKKAAAENSENSNTLLPPPLSEAEMAVINAQFPDAQVTKSGLRYIVRTPGTGTEVPKRGQQLVVNYEGRLLKDGTKFDSSYDRKETFKFQVGTGMVINGWDAAFLTMKKGEKRTLIIPWYLAYGARGNPPNIPPKSSLVFEVELLEIR